MEELALWISVLAWLAGMKAIPRLWYRLYYIVEFPYRVDTCDLQSCALKNTLKFLSCH